MHACILYAAVRHPQYLGLILITLGLSLLSLRRPRAPHIVLEAWLLQVGGVRAARRV